MFSLWLFFGSLTLAGLVIRANVWSCDPLVEGAIADEEQIAAFFVLRNLVKHYGLPGFFLASLLGASLR